MEDLYIKAHEMSFELINDFNRTRVSIEDFTMLRIIGKGSYAKVALVRMKSNNKIFALKILKKDYIKQKQQISHIKEERSILAEIYHPFVIQLNYAFQTDKKLYFVLDYCPGGEMFNLLSKKQKFNQEQAKFYAAQIVLALEHLHSKNIIYRDLKPENVLIDADGYIKITDFGLSKRNIKGNSGAYSICGTPEYLAPEVLQRKGHGKAVDWWALGSIIYEMVTGYPPFYCNNREVLYKRIINEELTYPKYVDKCLRSLFDGLFQKNPKFRFGASEIKSHAWFKGFDWASLLEKKIIPPFQPILKSETDVEYFDPEFTEISLISPNNSSNNIFTVIHPDSFDNNFDGFSFIKSSSYVDESIMVKNSEKNKENEKKKYEREFSLEFDDDLFPKPNEKTPIAIADEKELKEIFMEKNFLF